MPAYTLINDPSFMSELLREGNPNLPGMNDIYVDHDYIRKVLNNVSNNSAIGPDGVPIQVLKYGGVLVVDAIADLARISLDTGVVPDILKCAWIVPI